MYFADFAVGQSYTTTARTITEADIVQFAGLSGDFNQIHTDAAYAAASFFGQRIAHGLLALAIASGLFVQTGIMEATVLAFREILEWSFSLPVFIGDTIHCDIEVVETRAIPRLNAGAVIMRVTVLNQRGETVQQGRWNMFVQNETTAPD
jgi:acyl dehydratase